MASDIDIASNALQMIGGNSISSFDDPGGDAAVAKALFEPIAVDLLMCNYWRFGMKKQLLNKLSQTPLNEFQNAFQIPTDSIKIQRVFPRARYKIFQDKIHSNADSIELDYLFRADTSSWPPSFVLLITYKLASEFALSVTDNEKKNALYEDKFRTQLGKAFTSDAQQYPQTPIVDSPFTDVRN